MKKRFFAILAALCLLLTGCSTAAEPTPSAEPTTEPTADAAAAAAEDFAPIVSRAAKALERVRRDDLSAETFPYDGEPYSDTLELTGYERDYLEAAGDCIVSGMPEGLSAYDQYRYLAYVISLCAEYDYDGIGEADMTPYGGLVLGKAICLGYAYSFLWLCEKADLWCGAVEGIALHNGEDHGWNIVKLADGTYYVDVTWCDQLGNIGTSGWQSYFMLTEEVLALDHGEWSGAEATGRTVFD